MSNPQMTLNQLKAALERIPSKYGELPVTVWLPGSRIDLSGLITPAAPDKYGEFLIEGNLRQGSALS